MHHEVYEFHKPSGPYWCPRCARSLQPRAFRFIKLVDYAMHTCNYSNIIIATNIIHSNYTTIIIIILIIKCYSS